MLQDIERFLEDNGPQSLFEDFMKDIKMPQFLAA
jgi:hypothetical protein